MSLTQHVMICDNCGLPIRRPEEGLIEFISNIETGSCHGFRVTHILDNSPLAGGCGYRIGRLSYKGETVGDDSLYFYTGPDLEGRVDLLNNMLNINDKGELDRLRSKLIAAGYKDYKVAHINN